MEEFKRLETEEPILQESKDKNKYCLYPIAPNRNKLWELYKKHESSFWRADEVSLNTDVCNFDNLIHQYPKNESEVEENKNAKFFIKMILAFFATADGIVNENLAKRMCKMIKWEVLQVYYTFQQAIENIHNESYSIMVDTLVPDNTEKQKLFNAIDTVPCIKKKADWALKWINDENVPIHVLLVAFSCVEGIFFTGSFVAIFWLKSKGRMPGLSMYNDFISRDEGLHTEMGTTIYRDYLKYHLPTELVHQIIKEAVAIEEEFVCNAIPCPFPGMNSNSMRMHIYYVANRLSNQLGYEDVFKEIVINGKPEKIEQPFTFLELSTMQSKKNPHDKRPSEYAIDKRSDNLSFKQLI